MHVECLNMQNSTASLHLRHTGRQLTCTPAPDRRMAGLGLGLIIDHLHQLPGRDVSKSAVDSGSMTCLAETVLWCVRLQN